MYARQQINLLDKYPRLARTIARHKGISTLRASSLLLLAKLGERDAQAIVRRAITNRTISWN